MRSSSWAGDHPRRATVEARRGPAAAPGPTRPTAVSTRNPGMLHPGEEMATTTSDSEPTGPTARPGRRRPLRLVTRTVVKAWDDSIFGEAATAAFWSTLSLPPLLLALLGSLGYVAGWFGPDTIAIVQGRIVSACRAVFSGSVVDQIIAPTVSDILTQGHGEIVSIGFVLSLWAGSSAISSWVDAITKAHGQHEVRNPVWQRIFSLLLYLVSLVVAVFTLPLLALGPEQLPLVFPGSWRATATTLVDWFYYPAVGLLLVLALTTLYKVALPRKLPWHRGLAGALLAMVVFVVTATGLRIYIAWVTSTGFTYGALASPIAYLLVAFFLGFSIVLGAEFNNAIQELWPARPTRHARRRGERSRAAASEPARPAEPNAAQAFVPGPAPGAANGSGPAPRPASVQSPPPDGSRS